MENATNETLCLKMRKLENEKGKKGAKMAKTRNFYAKSSNFW